MSIVRGRRDGHCAHFTGGKIRLLKEAGPREVSRHPSEEETGIPSSPPSLPAHLHASHCSGLQTVLKALPRWMGGGAVG